MSKITCTCGHIIHDQSDMISNKAYVLADQDYQDFYDEIEHKNIDEILPIAYKYFKEVFQCENCYNLIVFRNGINKGVFFQPIAVESSKDILLSHLEKQWLGTMSANFTDGFGSIYWNTNMESGFRNNLSCDELKYIYNQKFLELNKLKILRHSFLRINGNMEHEFSIS